MYYTTKVGIFHLIVFMLASFLIGGFLGSMYFSREKTTVPSKEVLAEESEVSHWFLLHRKSNIEYLYYGVPGDKEKSELIKEFRVKTGVPGKKPTPLPELFGREYWVLIAEADSSYDPETSPYFLTLDVPTSDTPPYGPSNYLECEGPCNWEIPGFFGLHGTGGDPTKLSNENEGSSGCIRHRDEDITFLYNTLNPTEEEIRYYIKDI